MSNHAFIVTDAVGSKAEALYQGPMNKFTFLSLAPIESATYPAQPSESSPRKRQLASGQNTQWYLPIELASPPIDPADTTEKEIEFMLQNKRSNSIDSSESFGRRRFLKLAPVQHGDNTGSTDFVLAE